MEKNHWLRLYLVCISLFCLSVWQVSAQEEGWKVVDTEISSFEVPSDWINSRYEEPGNEYNKLITGNSHHWFLEWKTKQPLGDDFSWDDFQEISLEIMSKMDGKKLDWKTMRKMRRTGERPSTKRLFETEKEVCYECIYDGKDMNGEVRSWTNVIYYKEENNQVHRMEFTATTHTFKKKGVKDTCMRIIKSLRVKYFDMSK